jgi:hypothetical protein
MAKIQEDDPRAGTPGKKVLNFLYPTPSKKKKKKKKLSTLLYDNMLNKKKKKIILALSP